MRSGKMIASALALTLGLAATAVAQPQRDRPPGPPPGRPGGPGGMERLLQELRLSEKQQDQVRKVLMEHHEKMRKVAEQARADLLKQLKDVLSEEQYNRVKEQLERMPPGPPQPPGERRPEGREGPRERPGRPGAGDRGDRPGRPGPGGPREGAEGRDRPRGPEARRGPGGPGGMERILADLKLTEEQREKVREVFRTNHERLLKDMKEVLSEEQFKQFKQRLENRRPDGPPPGRRDREDNRRDRRDNP